MEAIPGGWLAPGRPNWKQAWTCFWGQCLRMASGSQACPPQDVSPPCPVGTVAASTFPGHFCLQAKLSPVFPAQLRSDMGLCLCGSPAWSALASFLQGLVQCHLLWEFPQRLSVPQCPFSSAALAVLSVSPVLLRSLAFPGLDRPPGWAHSSPGPLAGQ